MSSAWRRPDRRRALAAALLAWGLWAGGCARVVTAPPPRSTTTPRASTVVAPLPDDAPPPLMTLAAHDRLLVLAPHPDDESIGCGGLLRAATARGLPVRVVFLTYGDAHEWAFFLQRKHPVFVPAAVRRMGLERHDEALAATERLGVSPNDVLFLGYPDFGTLTIWHGHWGTRPPFRSLLTRVRAVPYASAYHPGAPYKGEEIVRDLTQILREFRPTKVFVSHPADHHPDHRALYLFTAVALRTAALTPAPTVYPYLVHFGRWPKPGGDHPEAPMNPPPRLAAQAVWQAFPLTPEEMARKRDAIQAHRSQYRFSAQALLAFDRTNELFGDFPVEIVSVIPKEIVVPQALPPASSEGAVELDHVALVGSEWRATRVEGDDVVITLKVGRPAGEVVTASIFLFGYRADQPFETMPKLRITLRPVGTSVDDQRRALPAKTVRVVRHADGVTVRVPRAALGHPEQIFLSARLFFSEVPLEWSAWHLLQLPSEPAPSASSS